MSQKGNIEAAVRHWLSVEQQHEYEMQGFRVELHTMTDTELLATKRVMQWFLDFAPAMFQVVAPKEYPRLRKTIAYLTELQQLQNDAWGRFMADGEKMQDRIKTWLEKHGSAKTV